MSASFRSLTSVFSATDTHTCDKPAGLAVGDLMVFFLFFDSGSTYTVSTVPDGFALLGTKDTSAIYQEAFWKIATAGDVAASTFSVVYTDAGPGAAALVAFSDVDTEDPFVASAMQSGYGSSPSLDPYLEAVTGDELLFAFWGSCGAVTFSNYATTVGDPASWTEDLDVNTPTRGMGAAHGVATASGDLGAWKCSQSSANNCGVCALILKTGGVAPSPEPDLFLDGVWG